MDEMVDWPISGSRSNRHEIHPHVHWYKLAYSQLFIFSALCSVMSSPSRPESPLPVQWSQSQPMKTRRRKANLSLRLDTLPAFGSHGFSYDCVRTSALQLT
jgi:hypothetical protein